MSQQTEQFVSCSTPLRCPPRWLIGLFGVVLWLGAGCGASSGATCNDDSDCSGDAVCADNRCAATCSDDSDCSRSGFTCQGHLPEDGEPVDVCKSADAGSNDDLPPKCENDQDCIDRLDDPEAECGIGRRCIFPPRHSLLIEDLTPVDPENPGPDGGLGADIAAVVLAEETRADSGFAWGDTLRYSPAHADRIDSSSHLEGNRPSLDESGRCVDSSFQEGTTQLGGEGGHLLVALRNADGERIRVSENAHVIVLEWGGNCGVEEASDDEYRVSLCVNSSGDSGGLDPEEDCDRRLGTGSGYTALPVSESSSQ